MLEGFHYYFHPVVQRAFGLAADGSLGEITYVEVRMAMPAPDDTDPRWSLEMAGGAVMDLGCYGLHIMRSLGRLGVPGVGGRPSITRAHAEQRTPGVDAWCDIEVGFPDGATGLSANSMVAQNYHFTIRIVGTDGDVLVHDFIRPNSDDGLTINTAAGRTVERLGTRSSYSYQLAAFADHVGFCRTPEPAAMTFADHVQSGTPLPFGTADAVANMTLVDSAYRAAGVVRQ